MAAGQPRFRGFSQGFNSRDSLRLLLCVGVSWAGSILLLSLALPKLLAGTIVDAISHDLSRQASPMKRLAPGSPRPLALPAWSTPGTPPHSLPATGEEAERLRQHLQEDGIRGALRRDPPSHRSWLGGYWLAVRQADPARPPLWVYASPGTAVPWLWPSIRMGSLLLGGSSGVVLFLQWQLLRPIQRVLRKLPAMPAGELELVPEGGLGAVRELSVRINRLLDQLNHQHEARRRFLQGLAHDLGSPLTRLSMRMEQFEDRADNPATQPEAWTAALPQLRGEINRLISLTHLLQQAAGGQDEPFQPRPSALDELCERVVASYGNTPIQLTVPRLLMRLDQALIERALQNLIDNALRYGHTPIRLSAQPQPGMVVLQVEDSGSGLNSPNQLGMPRIPPADDRQQRHRSGLGLTIVEHCCQLHGGHLVLNRSPLGGLQAELHLPQR